MDENLRQLDEATQQWAQADEDDTAEDSYVVVAACPVDPLEHEAPPPPADGSAANGEHAASSLSSGSDGIIANADTVEMHETSAAEWDGVTAQVDARAPFP